MSDRQEELMREFVKKLLDMEVKNFEKKSVIFRSEHAPSFWKNPMIWLRLKRSEKESDEWKTLSKKISMFYNDCAKEFSRKDLQEIFDLKVE